MFTAILLALGGAAVTGGAVGYMLACRHACAEVATLRARYRELLNALAQLEGQLPQADREPLRLLRGGRALTGAPM